MSHDPEGYHLALKFNATLGPAYAGQPDDWLTWGSHAGVGKGSGTFDSSGSAYAISRFNGNVGTGPSKISMEFLGNDASDGQYGNLAKGDYYVRCGRVPVITGVAPQSGPTQGGTRVTVTGSGLLYVRKVMFGGLPGTSLQTLSATRLQVTAPAHVVGPVYIRAWRGLAESWKKSADVYTYK